MRALHLLTLPQQAGRKGFTEQLPSGHSNSGWSGTALGQGWRWERRQKPRPSPAPPGCVKAALRGRMRAMGALGEEELPAVPNNAGQRNLGDPQ